MALKIHHMQAKLAKKLGVTLEIGFDGIVAKKDGKSASAPNATLAIAALLKLLGTTTAELMNSVKSGGSVLTNRIDEAVHGKAPRAKAAPKVKKTKAPKFKCEECGHTKSVQGEDGLECAECGTAAEDDGEGKSVVKSKYKMKYKPHKAKCGDDISKQVSAHVSAKDDDGKLKTDQDKLIRFAKANGVWDPNYLKLNGGMKRMNICNRLRGKVRRDKHQIVWPA